jgi:hypothetical protein
MYKHRAEKRGFIEGKKTIKKISGLRDRFIEKSSSFRV